MDDKDKVIKLLMKKNKIANRLLEAYFEDSKNIDKEISKYVEDNSKVLKELTKLGYAQEIKEKI